MTEFKEHDKIDRDIIKINKDSLILRLYRSKDFYISSSSAFGFGGTGLTLLISGYLTESFHNVGLIPGETVRAIFIALGLLCLGLATKAFITWIRFYKNHEPHQIVDGLLNNQDSISQTEKAKKVK